MCFLGVGFFLALFFCITDTKQTLPPMRVLHIHLTFFYQDNNGFLSRHITGLHISLPPPPSLNTLILATLFGSDRGYYTRPPLHVPGGGQRTCSVVARWKGSFPWTRPASKASKGDMIPSLRVYATVSRFGSGGVPLSHADTDTHTFRRQHHCTTERW